VGVELTLTEDQQGALEAVAAGESRVRHWRRYRAVLLLGEGRRAKEVAAALGCARSSVYAWAAAWGEAGPDGLREAPPPGRARTLSRAGGAGERCLAVLLAEEPQARGHHATGWTVSLLRTELAAAGHAVGERTVRRTLHRLGWRWKRPKYVLGRPDPGYTEKKPR
jgi:transposase